MLLRKIYLFKESMKLIILLYDRSQNNSILHQFNKNQVIKLLVIRLIY